MTQGTCTIEGCEKPLRSSGAEWCGMHYHRWYRHGSTDKISTRVDGVSLGRRYVSVSKVGHPLATKSGRVYVHRMVLFDAIGYGPHACHWCNTEVEWRSKGEPDELQPDHLNNDGGDNRIENLVPSCRACNTRRGAQRRAKALREAGFWSSHDTIERLAAGGRKPTMEAA